jgi:glycosyltransferase involved in cell wall biosynthesis
VETLADDEPSMIVSCVTTFNRLAYTQRCLKSLAGRTDFLVVEDNGSTDGTVEWLSENARAWRVNRWHVNQRNLYPGASTNKGWHEGMRDCPDATLLHRSDNDIVYAAGWAEHVEAVFAAHPRLGLYGVLNLAEDFPQGQPVALHTENGVSVNRYWPRIGGNVVIRRELWDAGLRWKAGPWAPGGNDEDGDMCAQVEAAGFYHANAVTPIASNIAFGKYADYPEYYNLTAEVRGLVAETSV